MEFLFFFYFASSNTLHIHLLGYVYVDHNFCSIGFLFNFSSLLSFRSYEKHLEVNYRVTKLICSILGNKLYMFWNFSLQIKNYYFSKLAFAAFFILLAILLFSLLFDNLYFSVY